MAGSQAWGVNLRTLLSIPCSTGFDIVAWWEVEFPICLMRMSLCLVSQAFTAHICGSKVQWYSPDPVSSRWWLCISFTSLVKRDKCYSTGFLFGPTTWSPWYKLLDPVLPPPKKKQLMYTAFKFLFCVSLTAPWNGCFHAFLPFGEC